MTTIHLSDVQWQERFGWEKAILFDETDLNSKGSKLQVIKLKENGVIKPHYHKVRTEVFCVLKGTGVITLDGEDIICKENDFLLCQPNTTHAFINNGNEDFIIAVFRTNDPGNQDMLWVKDNSI